jgi:hypothetical protein
VKTDGPGRDPGKLTSQAKRTQRRKDAHDDKKQRRMRDGNGDGSPDDDNDEVGPGGIEDNDVEMEDASEESEMEETPAEQRLRLAKEYLDKVRVEAVMCSYWRGAKWQPLSLMQRRLITISLLNDYEKLLPSQREECTNTLGRNYRCPTSASQSPIIIRKPK